jgi:peptidoglycan/LPS O-acetylase OafA/YrhL
MVKNPAPADPALDHFRSNSYFGGLDLLRGLSILLVIFHHVTGPDDTTWFTIFQSNGRYGVSLFFVISGFLIATLLLRELRTAGAISIRNFYLRRSLRILPLYFACLALHAVLVYALNAFSPENRVIFTEKLPSYLFFYSNWLQTATAGPFFQSWSLAAEEQFYLSFAFLLVILRPRWLVPLAAAAIAVKWTVFTTFGTVDTWSTGWRVAFSYQESIAWGVLLAFALENPVTFRALNRVARSPVFLAGAIGATLLWLVLYPIAHASTWDAELLYLAMTALVLAVVIRPFAAHGWVRPLAFVGRISYGIYLLHMVVIAIVKKLPHGNDPMVCFLVSTAVVIPAAAVVYVSFEKPIINFYKRRFSSAAGHAKTSRTAALPAMPVVVRP